jgi:uncharacterized protein (DUF302 family)
LGTSLRPHTRLSARRQERGVSAYRENVIGHSRSYVVTGGKISFFGADPMKNTLIAGAIAVSSTLPAQAELLSVPSNKSVTQTVDALAAAVENAGAKVFARVDHAGGAAKVGAALSDAELLIFGNPKIGTPAMQSDIRAGLFLPLKVLAYEDAEGAVFLTYEDPAEMFSGLDIAEDAAFVATMRGALAKLTAAAAQ